MDGAFTIIAGIAICLLIALFFFCLMLMGFGVYWMVEHMKEIKERQKEV